MSSKHELDRALRRASKRDRKRRTKMRVSGKSVLTLQQVISRGNKPKR